jgi:hypothetical protein
MQQMSDRLHGVRPNQSPILPEFMQIFNVSDQASIFMYVCRVLQMRRL